MVSVEKATCNTKPIKFKKLSYGNYKRKQVSIKKKQKTVANPFGKVNLKI